MLSEAKELNEKDLIPEIQADIEKSIQQVIIIIIIIIMIYCFCQDYY